MLTPLAAAGGSPIALSSSALDQLVGMLRDHMHRPRVTPWLLAAFTNAVRAHPPGKPLSAPLEDLPSTLSPLFATADLTNDAARWLCTVFDAVLPFPGQVRRCAEAGVSAALCDLQRSHAESGYVCAAALSTLTHMAALLPRDTFEQAAAAGFGELLPVVLVRYVRSRDVVTRAASLCATFAAGDPGFRPFAMRHDLSTPMLAAVRTHLANEAARGHLQGTLEAVWDPAQHLPPRLRIVVTPILLTMLRDADASGDAAELERAEACARSYGYDPTGLRHSGDTDTASLGASVHDESLRPIGGISSGGGHGGGGGDHAEA